MQRAASLAPAQAFIIGGGLLLSAALIAALLVVFQSGASDSWDVLLVGAILVAVTTPLLRRQARRENDPRLFWFLLLALVLKLVGALLRSTVEGDVYEGQADATGYHEWGVRFAEPFSHGNFTTGLDPLTGTNFIRFFTGLVYAVIGPSRLGGFLVYSWLAFVGLFFFYRAFRTAVPEGRRRLYAILLFLLPSHLFWASGTGKDAWMVFALGIAAYGAARVLTERTALGLAQTGLGLWLGMFVRPHVAALMGVALVAAYAIRRSRAALRELVPVVKVLSLAALVVVAGVVVARTETYLSDSGVDTKRGVTGVLQESMFRSGYGGSEYVPSLVSSPAQAPMAAATVLFRPLITEASNVQMLLAALEGTLLMVLLVFRIRWVINALKNLRRQPYVAFALAYTAMFVVAFSGFANFGLLARERVQLFPLYLVLFVIPPKAGTGNDETATPLSRRHP